MSRVRLIVAASAAVLGVALAGCSATPDWMPDWMQSKPPSAQPQVMRFESDPPGADVRTAQGQTCLTPCSLPVPSESQAVSFTKVGFISQTIQISAGEPPSHAFWENPPPTLTPNPAQVVLQALPPPPKEIRKRKPRPTASRTRTAAKMTPPAASESTFPDPPAQQQPAAPDPAFPPPPSGQ